MPKVRRSSYNLAFKLKVVAEAEAVENNSEIARDYGISESMVRRWRKDSREEMMRRSFKTCGISNALDGTEDDAIYDDEMPEVADDDMEDEFETDSEEDDDD